MNSMVTFSFGLLTVARATIDLRHCSFRCSPFEEEAHHPCAWHPDPPPCIPARIIRIASLQVAQVRRTRAAIPAP